MYTQQQIDNLTKNLSGTQWGNVRMEAGKLLADFSGHMVYPIGRGRYQPYEGITPCEIIPSLTLLNNEINHGIDQNGFVMQELDYEPVIESLF